MRVFAGESGRGYTCGALQLKIVDKQGSLADYSIQDLKTRVSGLLLENMKYIYIYIYIDSESGVIYTNPLVKYGQANILVLFLIDQQLFGTV